MKKRGKEKNHHKKEAKGFFDNFMHSKKEDHSKKAEHPKKEDKKIDHSKKAEHPKKEDKKNIPQKIDSKKVMPPKKEMHKKDLKKFPESRLKKQMNLPKGKQISKEKQPTYLKTNVEGFDALLKEGIPEGASVLVEGGPGSGKTIFCLELIKTMTKQGKKVLYMSFEEPEYRLRSHLRNFGVDPAKLEREGKLTIKRFNALDIARSVEALLSEAKKELLIDVQPVLIPGDFKPDIVLVDSLTSIGSAFSGEESRFRIYMEQLFRYLESHEITSFLIRETSNPTHIGISFVEKAEAVSFLSDGIIALYNVVLPSGIRERAMEIVKMRGVHIYRKIVKFDILGKRGIVVYPNRLLSGKYSLT